MRPFESTRANERRPGNRRHWVLGVALAVGAFLFGLAPLGSSASAQPGSHAISTDSSKKADKEAKKAERAAARAAKKKEQKEHAASKHKDDDDRSLAKAKTGKSASKSGSSVNLGDDDPLEGL
jgi:basic membrane lipoprotein Med (substrate-binding protein (PBP1-ABC) superfamily)